MPILAEKPRVQMEMQSARQRVEDRAVTRSAPLTTASADGPGARSTTRRDF